MRRTFPLPFVLMLFAATPAAAQYWFFPNTMVPTGGQRFSGAYVGLEVTRGLNEASGRVNGIGGSLGFLGEKMGAKVGGAVLMPDDDAENETTFGGAVAFDFTDPEASFGFGVQGGVGWLELGENGDGVTFLRFPLGAVLKARIVDSESTRSWLWVIPRVEIQRFSVAGESESENDFGVSFGISSQRENGFGFFSSADVLFPGEPEGCGSIPGFECDVEKPFILAGGISFRFGG